jgi:hypothetical protein
MTRTTVRPLLALVAVAAVGGALGSYFGLRAITSGAGNTGGAAPSPRTGAAMAYDAAREQVVLFGGQGPEGALDDTWTWNGSVWTQQHPAASPPARSAALMAYEPATRSVVMVGGADYPSVTVGFGCAVPVTAAALPREPLPAGSGEVAQSTACPKQPTPIPGVGPLRDTWRWDGSQWRRAADTPTTVSTGQAQMVTEPVNGTVLLVAAAGVQPQLGRPCPLLAPADGQLGCPPIARLGPSAYTLSASGWVRVQAPPSTDTGSTLTPAAGALAVDPRQGRAVLFQTEVPGLAVCGQLPTLPQGTKREPGALPCRPPTSSDGGPARCCAGRVLTWTGSRWVSSGRFTGGPALGPAATLVEDAATPSILLLDPSTPSTWIWNGMWTELHPRRQPELSGAAVVYDAKVGQVVLFGGWLRGGSRPTDAEALSPAWTDQTWTWDGHEWTQRTGSRVGASTPSPTPASVPAG